jgi:formylglycine-generating enzyme required for sulfatase activity
MTGKDGMTLVYVPEGEFVMGIDADDALAECQKYHAECKRDTFTDEEPQHIVVLDAYWIDQTEVTNGMYARCVAANVCSHPNIDSSRRDIYYGNSYFDNYPVVYVGWRSAQTYCEWADRRLPTEAEWEKAARGTSGNIYPWGNDAPNNTLLNFNDEVGDTTEVGKYPKGASPYGVLDMAGNVQEWVGSLKEDYPYNMEDGREDLNPSDPNFIQLWIAQRSCHFSCSDFSVRSTNRNRFLPLFGDVWTGFRCATDAE